MYPTARKRILALLISSATLVAGATTAGAQPPAADREVDAPPLPEIESVITYAGGPRYKTASDGTVYSPLDEPAVIRGHDNGQSTLYDNKKGLRFSYWSFGDTGLAEPNGDGKTFIGNTGARTTDLTMSDNVSSWHYDGDAQGPKEPWKLNATEQAWNAAHHDTDPSAPGCQPGPGVAWMQCGDEYAIWGGGIVADAPNRRMLSFYGLITRYHARRAERPDPDNPGSTIPCTDQDIENRVEACRAFLFDGVGIGIAVWTETPDDGDGWKRMPIANATDPSNPTALWPFDDQPSTVDVAFEKAIFAHDGYVYAYGCPGAKAGDCRLARASLTKPSAVFDRAQWRFYAGEDRDRSQCRELWSADVDCVVPLPVDTDGGPAATLSGGAAGTSIQWNPALRMFLAIYSEHLEDNIMYRVAHRPEGPWSEAGLLGRALPSDGTEFGAKSYAGFAHPEYAERNGLVQWITYAHTTGFFAGDLPLMKATFKRPRHR